MKNQSLELNPFSIRRWEFETDHVVWVPVKARDVLGEAPCHIQGVRGSGKTAILRIADYYTRRSNRLRLYNRENIIDRCLGIYVSFIEEFTDFMDDEEQPNLYYDYTILYCLSKVFDLLDDASRDGLLRYDRKSEVHVVERLRKSYDLSPSRYEVLDSFSGFASFLRRHCRTLRNDALAVGYNVKRVVSCIDGPKFFDDLCELLREHNILDTQGGHYFIKICVDDAHLSSISAQRKLNNILYRSRAPIFWNIAYVEGQFDPYDIDSRVKYVTGHDREFVDLNYRDDPSTFQEICERVYEIRVIKFLTETSNGNQSEIPDAFSNLKKYIGRIAFEEAFSRLVTRSKKSAEKSRISNFGEVLTECFPDNFKDDGYQAFIASCMFNESDDLRSFCLERNIDQVDNYFRQKGSAAIVIAARSLSLAVPYEGLSTLLYLSDGCLRDFLSLCAVLFNLDQQKPETKRAFFRGTKLSTDVQSRAFREYSETFVNGLHNPRQPHAKQLSAFVDGVGTLTYMLQTEDKRVAFTQPDLGVFRLDFDPDQLGLFHDDENMEQVSVREVIKEAIYTGAIRLEQGNITQSDAIEFRLSGVMCPNFQISPRKPKRRLTLSYTEISDLTARSGALEARDWANGIFRRWLAAHRNRDFIEPAPKSLL